MKKLMTICLVCILTAAAAQGIIITFDENGHGSYSFVSGEIGYPLSYAMFEGNPQGLGYYGLPWIPEDMTLGDVIITEPVGTNQELSDMLEFTVMERSTGEQVYTYATIFVFSDNSDGIDELADTYGIPAPSYTNVVSIPEEGPEGGLNGVRYTPLPGQPGYVYGQDVTYVFISDVPEPATICILGLGALSLIRRKK